MVVRRPRASGEVYRNHLSDDTIHVLRELELIEDAFNPKMRTRAMGAVLTRHHAALWSVFCAYAQADRTTSDARKQLASINVLECYEMCEDVGIFDKQFTAREMLQAFVKVNIDDDLYYQDDKPEGANSAELDFDEFEEVVARIFYTKVWLRTPAAERPELLETGFDAWLADEFVPRALDAVKRRKKGQAAKKM